MKTADIHIRDPYVLPLPEEGRYLLFGTTGKNAWSGPGLGFDCYESRDLDDWTGPIPVFRPPADFWSNTQFWAPECHPWQGRYYLFASFAKDQRQRGTQILVAERPEGPYRLHSDGPVTPRDWECLDGTLFVDDAGKPWMVFCHEWVQVEDGEMCALPLSDDLRAAAGAPTLLFRASAAAWCKPFEAWGRRNNRVTDGPFLQRLAGGGLVMLWSTCGHEGYAMGYALSDSGSILGPWRQSPSPIYGRDGGHGMLFHDFAGQLWMTLHHPNDTPNERPQWLPVVATAEGLAVAPTRLDPGTERQTHTSHGIEIEARDSLASHSMPSFIPCPCPRPMRLPLFFRGRSCPPAFLSISVRLFGHGHGHGKCKMVWWDKQHCQAQNATEKQGSWDSVG